MNQKSIFGALKTLIIQNMKILLKIYKSLNHIREWSLCTDIPGYCI